MGGRAATGTWGTQALCSSLQHRGAGEHFVKNWMVGTEPDTGPSPTVAAGPWQGLGEMQGNRCGLAQTRVEHTMIFTASSHSRAQAGAELSRGVWIQDEASAKRDSSGEYLKH